MRDYDKFGNSRHIPVTSDDQPVPSGISDAADTDKWANTCTALRHEWPEAIEMAAKAAGFHSFTNTCPHAYRTQGYITGSNRSGLRRWQISNVCLNAL